MTPNWLAKFCFIRKCSFTNLQHNLAHTLRTLKEELLCLLLLLEAEPAGMKEEVSSDTIPRLIELPALGDQIGPFHTWPLDVCSNYIQTDSWFD